MKKNLTKNKVRLYHYVDDCRVDGPNPDLWGNCSGLSGNCSYLRGDLDGCEISDKDRANGVNINDLVGE